MSHVITLQHTMFTIAGVWLHVPCPQYSLSASQSVSASQPCGGSTPRVPPSPPSSYANTGKNHSIAAAKINAPWQISWRKTIVNSMNEEDEKETMGMGEIGQVSMTRSNPSQRSTYWVVPW